MKLHVCKLCLNAESDYCSPGGPPWCRGFKPNTDIPPEEAKITLLSRDRFEITSIEEKSFIGVLFSDRGVLSSDRNGHLFRFYFDEVSPPDVQKVQVGSVFTEEEYYEETISTKRHCVKLVFD